MDKLDIWTNWTAEQTGQQEGWTGWTGWTVQGDILYRLH